MPRTIVDEPTAAGMLNGLKAYHECTEACTSRVVIGRLSAAPKTIQLTCPYTRLDPTVEGDRRIIQSMYAGSARSALAASMGRTPIQHEIEEIAP